jgi:hypothetical protein
MVAVTGVVAMLWSSTAMATITQGDFSIFGFVQSRWSGRWGEGGAKGAGTPAAVSCALPGICTSSRGLASSESGGSFDFNRWDLVQARQLADLRPNYHLVKNYNLLGRLDTLVLKDADLFAFYRPWYDAFGDIKKRGIAQPGHGWNDYTQNVRVSQFTRNDLREFYAQLNFTDNFSMRVGKQQVIWSEADALSGTELTNTSDLSYHWTHFESAENLRKNVRMVKFNYLLPDYFQTANNELEFFVIPGDYQGTGVDVRLADGRSPWTVRAPLAPSQCYPQTGQPARAQTFADGCNKPMFFSGGLFFDQVTPSRDSSQTINSIDNSEFGVRLSSLLPVGNGLQTSLIYLYEARLGRSTFDVNANRGQAAMEMGLPVGTPGFKAAPGVFIFPGVFKWGAPQPGVPKAGTIGILFASNQRRNHYVGVTGTYYDKDLTDVVYRYDFFYAPRVGIGVPTSQDPYGAKWTQQTRWIVAGDRPTYIPWLSKQHTFLVAQYVATWYPGRPTNSIPSVVQTAGKVRELSSFGFLAATNWLWNGQWVSTNVLAWDIDNNVGSAISTNSFRYSRNVLFGMNAIWYLGRSGRFSDPFVFSRNQRINELEVSVTYEI